MVKMDNMAGHAQNFDNGVRRRRPSAGGGGGGGGGAGGGGGGGGRPPPAAGACCRAQIAARMHRNHPEGPMPPQSRREGAKRPKAFIFPKEAAGAPKKEAET